MPVHLDTAVRSLPWWRHAVIYQVYIRSFADGSGDGIGDIAGIRSRLPYLHDLGVDAIWVTPWYPSPMADAGYDVADYRDIDPVFGTLPDAEALIAEAHELGIRVLVDLVPNHTSDQHAWFQAALTAGPGTPERARYWFRPGRGANGELPPNNWRSLFGGSAWTRVPAAGTGDTEDREWYLHLFSPEQPDLNWDNPEVREEFEEILRFWLDRGVDGFRIDVAHGLVKHPRLPDLDLPDLPDDLDEPDELDELDELDLTPPATGDHPYLDRDELQEIYRAWRQVARDYPGDRVFVAEAWVANPERLTRYVDDGVLNTVFNFDFLQSPWDAEKLRAVVDATLAAHTTVGAPATWVLSNHDVVRHLTRYGRSRTGLVDAWHLYGAPTDLDLGTRRARAAALLCLALPGNAYIYQGEELGLWEVEDLPQELLQDPARLRSGLVRDGCRVPLPWSGSEPPFGFSDRPSTPWLPQPQAWAQHTVERQQADPDSVRSLYRRALQLRRKLTESASPTVAWLDSPAGTLVFERGPDWRCIVNLTGEPIPLPDPVLLTSAPLDSPELPTDTTAWVGPSFRSI